MNRLRSITIAGGGLAGLTLGIGLRQRGVPATIWEAGQYPRHKVCGEFISGKGQEVLKRLGLDDLVKNAGAIPARTARFYFGDSASPVRALNPEATCISRFKLDSALAEFFIGQGGELRQNSRWDKDSYGEGVVRATGRRRQASDKDRRWFGIKMHVRNVELDADLEMHGSNHHYVGLCKLPDGEVNICGLFAAGSGVKLSKPREWLLGSEGTQLRERLAGASLDENSFCSVAGLCLEPQLAAGQRECRLGDCLTMIPPVTGNGMSMAFEAAEILVQPLFMYANGDLSWSDACGIAAANCDRAFRQRLRWAHRLQALMFCPVMRGPVGNWVLRSELLWRAIFSRTR